MKKRKVGTNQLTLSSTGKVRRHYQPTLKGLLRNSGQGAAAAGRAAPAAPLAAPAAALPQPPAPPARAPARVSPRRVKAERAAVPWASCPICDQLYPPSELPAHADRCAAVQAGGAAQPAPGVEFAGGDDGGSDDDEVLRPAAQGGLHPSAHIHARGRAQRLDCHIAELLCSLRRYPQDGDGGRWR